MPMIVNVIAAYVMFQILMLFIGGPAMRSVYAWKIGKHEGVLAFFWTYLYSYTLTGDQIREEKEYLPDVNAQLGRLLALALSGEIDVWVNKSSVSDRFEIKLYKKHGSAVEFDVTNGRIDNNKMLISTTNFIMAKRLEKLLGNQKTEKPNSKINLL